jgi:hypothetical protein
MVDMLTGKLMVSMCSGMEEDYEKRRHSAFFTPAQKKIPGKMAADHSQAKELRYLSFQKGDFCTYFIF